MPSPHLRVARPTNSIAETLRFYRDGLGLEVIGSFQDHDGFDGIMLGHRHGPYHFEFTVEHGTTAPLAPTSENLLVLYLPDGDEHATLVERMHGAGYQSVASHNPYWDRHGVSFQDGDGYRVVLANFGWTTDPTE